MTVRAVGKTIKTAANKAQGKNGSHILRSHTITCWGVDHRPKLTT